MRSNGYAFLLVIVVLGALLSSRAFYGERHTVKLEIKTSVPVGNISNSPAQFSALSSGPRIAGDVSFSRTPFVTESSPGIEVHAHAALIADLSKQDSIFSRGEGKQWPLASLTKLMTAAVALEVIGMHLPVGPLPSGERYYARDLVTMMLLASYNDAAEAIADSYGRKNFMEAMNRKAIEWGMHDTYFADPTGLSVSNQSTIQDIRIMVEKIMIYFPEVLATTRSPEAFIVELDSGEERSVMSNNEFVGRNDFLGGKTGYTDDAIGNLVSVFTHHGSSILVVVLGTEDRFGETRGLYQWFQNGANNISIGKR